MALFPNWNGSASLSSYGCSPTCGPTWCSATIGRTFPAPTMTWNAGFAGSRPSSAASVVARIGTPISYATGARSPTPPGGSKTRPIESFWNSAPPSWTGPAGANCDGRPPSLRASNSRAFVFVTSATAYSLPLSSAGSRLLSRHLCPDGFFNWCLSLTTPLLGHSLLCPYVVDVTDTDCDAKAGLQLCLDPAGRNLRVSGAYLDEPHLRLYRSTCTDGRGDHPGMPRRLSLHRAQAGGGGKPLNERSSTDSELLRPATTDLQTSTRSAASARHDHGGLSSHGSILFTGLLSPS